MRQRYSGYCQGQQQKKWVQCLRISFSVFHFGQSLESAECGCEQLTHFSSRLQSEDACSTDAYLEHVNFEILSTLRVGNTRPLPGHSSIGYINIRKKLHPGVPPRTTESNKGGSVPVIWQNQARRLPGVHPEHSATTTGQGSNGVFPRSTDKFRGVFVDSMGTINHSRTWGPKPRLIGSREEHNEPD
ncbi:hypothetical protein TNCV_784241 [Trichonephila clavipes]|nr:hypothetical protein TNCV_784241 [Trichonephila clavipes]